MAARRRIALAALVLLVVAGALVGASWIATRIWGPALARERLEAALGATLGQPVRVEHVSVEPWLGRVVVAGIAAGPGPAGAPVEALAIGRVEAQVGISSLWHRRIVLRRILVGSADVTVAATGGPAADELPIIPSRLVLGPLEVEISAIELRGARLVSRDRARGLEVEVQGLDATARPGAHATRLTLAAAGLDLRIAGLRERVTGLEAAVEVTPRSIGIARLAATWAGHGLAVEGRIAAPLTAPDVELRVTGELDLEAVARVGRPPWPVAGVIAIDGSATGPVSALAAQARVTAPALAAGPISARRVTADLGLDRGVLTVTRAAAHVFGGDLTGSVALDLARPETMRLQARLRNGSLTAIEPLLGMRTGAAARLDLDAEAAGDPRHLPGLRGRARLEARAVRLDALAAAGAGTLAATGSFAGGVLHLERAEAAWPGLGLTASGRASLDGPERLHVGATADLARVASVLGGPALAGEARLAAELGGRWSAPLATGQLELRSAQLAGVTAHRAEIPFSLAPPTIGITGASITLGTGRIAASGRARWPAAISLAALRPGDVRARLSVRAEGVPLDAIAAALPPALRGRGPLSATAEVEGTLRSWQASGQLTAAALELPRAPAVEELSAAFRGGSDGIEITSLSARVLGAPVTARGAWFSDGTGELRAESGALDLAAVPGPPAWLAIRGRARATVSVVARDGAVSGSARILATEVSAAGVSLGRGSGQIVLADAGVRAELEFPDARASATATGPLDGSAAIAVRATIADLALEPVLRAIAGGGGQDLGGTISARAELDVPLARPAEARGLISLHPARFVIAGQVLEGRAPIAIRREPDRLVLERLELSGPLGDLSARATLSDAGSLEATVRGRAPLGILASLVDELREVSGTAQVDLLIRGTRQAPLVTGTGALADVAIALRSAPVALRAPRGRLSLDAPAGGPRSTRGELRLDAVAIEVGGEVLQSDAPVVLRREPGRVTLEPVRVAGRAGTLRLSARVDDGGALDGAATGRIPLSILSSLRPEVREAAGTLDLDVRLGGRVAAPALRGTAVLADGLLAPRDYPIVLRDMQGRLTFGVDRVRIDELRASLAGGSLRASGDIALDGRALGPYHLVLTARSIAGPARPGLETLWDADLELAGRGARGQLGGEARLLRGLYTRDLSLLPLLLERSPGQQAADVGRQVVLNVDVKLQDSMVVRTRQASLRAGGSLALRGTLAAPVVFGFLAAREGTITFQRNRFTLESATVRFDDPRQIDPVLDVRATTRIRTYDITMDLTGRVEDLQIRLSSVPPLPQEDLLGLVALGATREELGRSPTTIFAGEAARVLAETLLGPSQDGPLLDVFDVDATGPSGPQFAVGKRLNPDVLVVYSGSVAEGGQQKLRIEYQVLGPFLLSGEQNFRGGVAGDVVLRFRFR